LIKITFLQNGIFLTGSGGVTHTNSAFSQGGGVGAPYKLIPAPLMVVGTGLGEVFLKVIIMSLVFDTLNWKDSSHQETVIANRPMLILLSFKETNNYRMVTSGAT